MNLLWANNIKCTNKQFLLNILDANGTWYPVKTNLQSKHYPFDILHINKGMIQVKKNTKDFHPIILNIDVDNVGEIGIFMYDPTNNYFNQTEYHDKDFIFKPFYENCKLDKILIEIKIIDSYNKQKEIIILKNLVNLKEDIK